MEEAACLGTQTDLPAAMRVKDFKTCEKKSLSLLLVVGELLWATVNNPTGLQFWHSPLSYNVVKQLSTTCIPSKAMQTLILLSEGYVRVNDWQSKQLQFSRSLHNKIKLTARLNDFIQLNLRDAETGTPHHLSFMPQSACQNSCTFTFQGGPSQHPPTLTFKTRQSLKSHCKSLTSPS